MKSKRPIKEVLEDLENSKRRALSMGGEAAVKKHADRGRLNVRQRLEILFDSGSFLEFGLHADHAGVSKDLAGKNVPADGVVTGVGRIDSRDVFVIAYDFTVLAGTMGRTGEAKCARIREMALKQRKPIVWLIDSAGARVQELGGSFFSTTGYLFREQAILSGVVPQVSVVLGPGAAGTAYIPALSDCVIMVENQGVLALGGPPLVEAVIGEKISEQDLGGASVHLFKSGVAHMGAKDDREALLLTRKYLSYFPSSSQELPPRLPLKDNKPPGRADESLLKLIPEDSGSPFDTAAVIDHIFDSGSILPFMNDFGKSLITCFARLGGYSVGIVASASMHLGGVLENDSSDKGARFVQICDAFGIPLVFLQDVPGFLVGSRVERAGIIRHGARLLYAVSNATVPKFTIVVRKAYGAGYYVLCGRGYEPDYIAIWPGGEIALMGAEGAVNIMYGNKFKGMPAEEAAKLRTELEDAYRDEVSSARAAALFGVDELLDPRDTPVVLYRMLELTRNKHVLRPERKHGIFPV
ncbi:MAG: acyl-CoA carboxylase subunit beta [Leptospirales bacterium]|nr:acyl-CoA carboxylase subunit beta [Leptospirales bacterium]